VKICNPLVKNVKNYGFSDRNQGGQIQFSNGPNLSWKGAKKSQKAKRKFWSQQVLFGTKFLNFGSKRLNLATLTPMYSIVNRTSATSYNYEATIAFFAIAQR